VLGAVYANSFRPVQPRIVSTGFRTHSLRYDGIRELRTRTAEEFLVNSRLVRHDVEFQASVGEYFAESGVTLVSLIGQDATSGRRAVGLPASIPLRMELGEAIRRRRSVRAYSGEPIPLSYLATIARAAAGITGVARAGADVEIPLRSAPSAGGLYPIEFHIAALRIDDLPRRSYQYDARRDLLWETGPEATVEALLGAVAAPEEIVTTSDACAVILLVARPWRSMRKYGPRGMRHVLHEAGAIAEHANLTAAALGIGSVDFASFFDDEVHEALGLDGLYRALVHALVLGVPA
jgi:SagB-type dehydrogenase family enzyme